MPSSSEINEFRHRSTPSARIDVVLGREAHHDVEISILTRLMLRSATHCTPGGEEQGWVTKGSASHFAHEPLGEVFARYTAHVDLGNLGRARAFRNTTRPRSVQSLSDEERVQDGGGDDEERRVRAQVREQCGGDDAATICTQLLDECHA
ncbi:hypothetical protein K438DRAFT_1763612 [Mycena galopus ATCC 62051]|nr:hypothetical protein K438DRAFT_1763612 [Mycena galopus ATCC 62051]